MEPQHRLLLLISKFQEFNQEDPGQQRAYLERMINKGIQNENERISSEELQALIEEGKAKGYIQNGKPCVSIGPNAKVFFYPKETGVQGDRQEEASLLSEQEDIYSVSPKEFIPPAKPGSRPARKIGPRLTELLAEMEQRGQVTASKPHVELARSIKGTGAGDAYAKAFQSLVKQGMFTIDKQADGKSRVTLSAEGRELIATLKAYPEYIRGEPAAKLHMGTSFKLIEYVLENVAYDEEEGSSWLFPLKSEAQIFEHLATELDISTDAITRRVYDLYATRGLVEVLKEKASDLPGNLDIVTNIRVTPKGIAYYRAVIEATLEKEDALNDEEVWEADVMLQQCIRMAIDSGAEEIARELKVAADAKHFFEMGRREFTERVMYLQELQGNLLEGYAVRELTAAVE